MMFDNRYQAILADTDESKKIHFHLRYQVYCLDKHFEDPKNFEDDLEIDEYDEKSAHFLILDRNTGKWMATMRLVIAAPEDLPMHEVTSVSLDKISEKKTPIAELSRLTILKNFRHNSATDAKTKGIETNGPEMLLGLLRAANSYCRNIGVRQWVFLCKRSMGRIFEKSGLTIKFAGGKCEHKGTRYPFWTDLEKLFLKNLRDAPKVFRMFNTGPAYYRYSELTRVDMQQAA